MLSLLTELQERFVMIALMYARIVPIFVFFPLFTSNVLGSLLIRNALILLIIIGLWPVFETNLSLSALNDMDYAVLVAKEGIIGASIGLTLALPFWIFSALGAYIDTARGASMGSLIDPTSGQESTEAANFINFCVLVVYLEIGGMRFFLETLAQSYQTIGLMQGFTINLEVLVLFLSQIITEGFIVAAPILLMLLLTECLLGMFSRFTPQLNAFSLSLTIKSVIAFFVLLMYFWQVLPEKLLIFMGNYPGLHFLHGAGG
jgi:type III secretion system export apparatus protein